MACASLASSLPAQTCATSVTGNAVAAFAPLDGQIQSAIEANNVKGASLAITYNGRLIFARGYGCADIDSNTPVKPDTLMRVASVSKTFTSVGVLLLYQQGKLSLDAKVFGTGGILADFQPIPGKTLNPDLMGITVRHLLNHSGGWDRSTTQHFNGVAYGEPFDSQLPNVAATLLGDAQPGTITDGIRAMLSQPIQHPPGTYYAYSNFGYVLLGRVIEKVSGVSYEQYVQQNILKPLGIGRQKLGATIMSDTVNGEATYYDTADAPMGTSPFPTLVPGPVTRPYAKLLENVDSAGEWVSNAVDLSKFLDGIDGRRQGTPALLNSATLAQMVVNPNLPNEPNAYYGLGFLINNFATGNRWTKGGDLIGTASEIVHTPIGYSFALLFNGNPAYDPNSDDGAGFEGGLSNMVLNLINQLGNSAPAGDQYSSFQSTLLTPAVTAVEQGATYQPLIVAGSWVTITGQNLGTATRTWLGREFDGPDLPSEIDHVLVTIDGKNASVYYVSPTQLNVQAPTDTATGPVAVQVIRDGTVSASFQATLAAAAPGFFTYTANNNAQELAAIHLNGAIIGDVAGTLPAKAGEVVELYATGLGASTGGVIPAAPITLSELPIVTLGGVKAVVSYAGIVSPGLFQINVTIPSQLSVGRHPATIEYGGVVSPTGPGIVVGN